MNGTESTRDDALIERIAEAIYAAHGSPSGMMPTYLADARAVYDVAYPAIHDKTIDEVEQLLSAELPPLDSNPFMAKRQGISAGVYHARRLVRSLRSDSKGDSDANA